MRLLLSTILLLLGVSAIAIGLMFFFFGAQFTANFFSIIPAYFGSTDTISGFDTADIDGEFRFYSVFWIAYGAVLISAARALDQWMKHVPLLASLFFLGGIGRVLSILTYGMPSTLFVILLVFEMLLPVIMIGLWLALRRTD